MCLREIETDRFKSTGIDPKEALKGAYFRASMNYRNAGDRKNALHAYFQFCKNAFSPPIALYRFCRYLGSMILNRW
jgi:hypothetical protein